MQPINRTPSSNLEITTQNSAPPSQLEKANQVQKALGFSPMKTIPQTNLKKLEELAASSNSKPLLKTYTNLITRILYSYVNLAVLLTISLIRLL